MNTQVALVPAPPSVQARPDDVVLPSTAERIRRGVPKNTQRSYAEAWENRFLPWCHASDREPLPTSSATLADYVSHLCDRGLAPSTIKHDMGVISARNQAAGLPPLGKEVTKAANLALRGHRQDWAETGKRAKKAPPLTIPVLRKLNAALDPKTLAGCRTRFMLSLGVHVAARRSELAAFHMSDLSLDADGDLQVWFRKSKTDQDALGVMRVVPAEDDETDTNTNPVVLYRAWLAALQDRNIDTTQGRLFKAITKSDKPYQERTITRTRRGKTEICHYGGLSGDAIDDLIRRTATLAKLTNARTFSGHSPRAGYATEMANRGVPVAIWAEYGRWDPKSPVPHEYVRAASQKLDNPWKRPSR